MGPDVTLVSSADETAFATREVLQRLDLLRTECAGEPVEHRFYSSGDISWFADLGGRLLGPELGAADHWQPPGMTIADADTSAHNTRSTSHDPLRRPCQR